MVRPYGSHAECRPRIQNVVVNVVRPITADDSSCVSTKLLLNAFLQFLHTPSDPHVVRL